MLPQTRRFNDHEFLFVYDGKMEAGKMDRKFGATSAVSLALGHTIVAKTELSHKIKHSFINRSVYAPTLALSHELWVATERTRSRVQAAEMRVAGWLGLRDRVRSSNIWGARTRAAALWRQKGPVEVVEA